MSSERTTLDIPDLDDFAPRPKERSDAGKTEAVRKAVDKASSFPSREASEMTQLHIHAPREIAERFKAMAKDDRRSYYAMLEILMDNFEGKSG